MTDMNLNAVLRDALENEIINLAYIQEQVEEMQKNEILSHHPYKIWEGKDGKWYTYLPDKERGRVLKKRSTEQGIKQVVIDYWKDKLDNPTVEEVFTEWNDRKLELKKISEATHLRNRQIYKRHFDEFGQRKIKSITPEEMEEFLEEQIPEHNLKAKAFSNLKTVTRGMLKRAKKRKLISFNVTEIFNDLDVSDKDFALTIINMEEEVFDESEMPEVIRTHLENMCMISKNTLKHRQEFDPQLFPRIAYGL